MPSLLPGGLQAEVEDMIWEVDKDCDGLVDWPEFQAMWGRCRQDKAGEWAEQSGAAHHPSGGRSESWPGNNATHMQLSAHSSQQAQPFVSFLACPLPLQAPSRVGCTMLCSSCCTTAAARGG
jgi:hypothetical protein